jgi:hypothetical protein
MNNLFDAVLLAYCVSMCIILFGLFLDKYEKYKRGY